MTKREAVEQFTREILPIVKAQYERDGRPDWPARSEAWNNWTDALCKDGTITSRQYSTWTAPPCCGK